MSRYDDRIPELADVGREAHEADLVEQARERVAYDMMIRWIKPHAKPTLGRRGAGGKPVVCVDTGRRYDSVAAAARDIGMHENTLGRVVRRGGRTPGGLAFDYEAGTKAGRTVR